MSFRFAISDFIALGADLSTNILEFPFAAGV
jgi:hypothetical protein